MIIRRIIVLGIVAAFALALPFIQNRVLVGDQEFLADLSQQTATQYEVLLRDTAGNAVSATEEERLALIQRFGKDEKRQWRDLPLTDEQVALTDEGTIEFEITGDVLQREVRERILQQSFKRKNDPLDWFHINLGIDLRGGVEFNCTLRDDNGAKVSATDDVVSILRKRLDARGLAEPQVFRLANGDVQVVIPGGTRADAARTRKVIESTGKLEFREGYRRYSYAEAINFMEKMPSGQWRIKPRERFSLGLGQGDVILPAKPARGEEPEEFFHLGPAKLSGNDVSDAYETMQEGRKSVGISFSVAGGAKNQDFTSSIKLRGPDNGGNGSGKMGISLDGFVESYVHIQSPSGRNSVITGSFSQDEIDNLRLVLKAGSLSVKPEITSERVVGATLGADTIEKGLTAMVDALLAVLVSMLVYYWWRFGTVACASLVTCVVLIVAAVSAFGATLTLPGLAGLVLTVGMAVDANILIFERIREESGPDIDIASSIDAGYRRAFLTIFDANITTFLTAFVLFLIGSGPVKGFGLTLMIGIITSLFGAVYVGRLVTEILHRNKDVVKIRSAINIPETLSFVKLRFPALILSVAVFFVAWGVFLSRPMSSNFDIDFTGGNMVQVTLREARTLEEVRDSLGKLETDKLNVSEIAIQPYFSSFEDDSELGTKQFLFKAADPEASKIENEKLALEREQHALLKKYNALQEEENPSAKDLRDLENEMRAYDEKIIPLKEALAGRVNVFKDELGRAFGDAIGAEGSEVVDIAWKDNVLGLRLQGLRPLTQEEELQIVETLRARNDIAEAKIGHTDDIIEVQLKFNDGSLRYPETLAEGPIADRIRSLLAARDISKEDQERLADKADQIIAHLDSASASIGVQLATPYPASDYFSPQVAKQMQQSALLAMAGSLLAILVYIAMRFEFRFGIGAIAALFHDVLIAIGLLALFGVRIDLTVIAALLTIVGYSLNDTIVLFDRIRENLPKYGYLMVDTIDPSVRQTMSRTLLTSITTIVAVSILLIFGGEGIMAFSFTMLIGLLLGTYSSVFIAAPVLLLFKDRIPEEDDAEKVELEHGVDPEVAAQQEAGNYEN